ncbi:PREDICTED: zinc finger BED domain-containing protein 6 [Crocodylus porosus]|uniref:Zinc finger BED-type containing 6 n=1 Tax=Crocodylus porosus TaxID=8502 RepID=A0A7M4EVT6_CROPO|nr:PREDICTED: zinc finger BED domain-containing protein 6 [Crocodylus porosus]
MSACSLSVPVSPPNRCSSYRSARSLEFSPSARSDTEDEDKAMVEGEEEKTEQRAKGKGTRGTKGKPHHKKLGLSKKFVKDLRPAAAPEQNGERFFMESNTVKHVLLPGARAKTSIVWNFFHIDPQYTWRAICSICKKSVSRGKPGTHLGTSTLQRHLQAKHSVHWTVATKINAVGGSNVGEDEYAFNMPVSPVSPDSRGSSLSSSGSSEYVPSINFDGEGVEEAAGQFFHKKRRKRAVQVNEFHPRKRQLARKFAKDVIPTGTTTAASTAPAIVISGEDREPFLIESNTVKRVLVPGTRTKTSAVWNFFYIDPQYTWRAVCTVCKKSVSRGRPGTHLGTSTLQRHLQAMHPVHWAMANKSNGTLCNGVGEEAAEDFPPSPAEVDMFLARGNDLSRYFSSRDKLSAGYSLTPRSLGVPAPAFSPKSVLSKRKALSPSFGTNQDSQIPTTVRKIRYRENPVAQQINRAITELIIEDMQPYSFFSTPAFQRFMQIVAPDYQLPSRTYFSTKAVPRLHSVVREKVSLALEKAELHKVHLSIDMWTCEPALDYLTVMAHWVSYEVSSSDNASRAPNFRKQAALCVTGFAKDYTAASILQELNYQIGVWLSPSSLTPGFVVSDSTANVVRAVKDGGFTHVPCFMHCLNVIIQDFLCEHKSTESMLAAAREICLHFNRSTKTRQVLQKFQHVSYLLQHSLKQEVATWWISTFYMLKRLLEQRKAVHDYSVQHRLGGRAGGVILTSLQWSLMAHVCDILEPFVEATREMSACTAGLSQALPLVRRLLLTLQNMRKDFQIKGATLALGLVDDLSLRIETDSRLCAVLRSEHYILATLLDPFFKDSLEEFLPRGSDLASYKQILIEAVSEHMCLSMESCPMETRKASGQPAFTRTDPFARHFKKDPAGSGPLNGSSSRIIALTGKGLLCPSAATIVEEYFHEKPSRISVKDDPLTYWQGKLRRWPALTQVAIQYLGCPPCSLHSEWLFSSTRHLVSEHRASSGFDNIEQLMFLKINLKSINYDYSTLALGFDTEDEVTQSSEDEMF